MILFLSFLGLWIGISLSHNIILNLIFILGINIVLFYKIKKRLIIIFDCLVLIGIIISLIKFDITLSYYQGVIIESKTNYFIMQVGYEKLYIYKYEHNYEIGDILKITGFKQIVEFPTIESEFDFQRYLNNKGIYNELKPTSIEEIFLNPIRFNSLRNIFLNKFDQNSQSFVSSIFFSKTISQNLNQNFEKLHLYRLFNSSGIYLYAANKILIWILDIFFKNNKSKFISYIILFPYILFNIGKIFVIKKILILFISILDMRLLHIKLNYIEKLSICGILLLLLDRYLAFQESFTITFLLTFYVYFANNSFPFLKPKIKKIFISLLIWLFFIPFEVYFYNELSLFSFPFQMLFLPISIVIYIIIFLCFFNFPLFFLVDYLVGNYYLIVKNISSFSLNIYFAPFSNFEIVLYFSILLVLIYIIAIRCKPLYKLSYILVAFLCIKSIPFSYIFKDYIAFINVGQGDSTLIVYNKKTVLIDTGGSIYKDIANDSLIPFFKKRQIYHIDYVITTHDDFDHSGALNNLKENFSIKNYVNAPNQFPLIIDKSFIIHNLNIYQDEAKNENDKSLVLYFSLNNLSFLIMGDAPKWVEHKIINDNKEIKCDVLKVGHHGSNTSTSQQFIEFIKPKDAIISVGKNNEYGHPHSEVIAILKYYDINIKRTDIESTIYYFIN